MNDDLYIALAVVAALCAAAWLVGAVTTQTALAAWVLWSAVWAAVIGVR